MKKLLTITIAIILSFLLSGCDIEKETRDIKSCVLTQYEKEEARGEFIILFASAKSSKSIKTDYYLFIKGVEGFRLQKINSDNLEIVETNELEPQIKGNFDLDGKVKDGWDYIVYVPEGTITQEYKIDVTSQEGAKPND